MEVSKVDVSNCKQGYVYICCLGFYYHPSRILIFCFGVCYNHKKEDEHMELRVVHRTRYRADPRWIQLVPIDSFTILYCIFCCIHNVLITTLQNVMLQKSNSVGRKKEQLLQSLSSKLLNDNEKSNDLIWSGQESFSSGTYPLLWQEGWSWYFKKKKSVHLPPLPLCQTTK